MSWASFDLEGFKELNQNLRGLEAFVDSKEVVNALLDGIKVIQRVAKAKASRGPTGNLRRGIVARPFLRQRRRNPAVYMGIDYRVAPHAHLVEFGTLGIREPKGKALVIGGDKTYYHAGGGKISRTYAGGKFVKWVGPMPARPFWRPSVDSYKMIAGKRAADKIALEIERATSRKRLQQYARWG